MLHVWAAMREGGPWAILLLAVAGYLWARHRGIIVTKEELDRMERRIEKDTDRVLDLYKQQIGALEKVIDRKDATIGKLQEQNDKLMSHSAVSAHALGEIMEEARRRGLVQ